MLLDFEDGDLRRLYVDADFCPPWMGVGLRTHYRRKVGLVADAPDERDLRAMRSLHFEKLTGKREGQHSIRLNDQYRLILRLRTDGGSRVAVVVEVVDYH